MPGFELEQVDGGGEPINLPHGDTVIGRGPFLSVSDKRVSRNHAILENMDGQLRLKPTHVNPCFVQTSLDASPQPLEKDQWHCLKDGSIFSLLPGKHIFRVRAVAEEGTPRNRQGFEKEEEEVMETASEMEQNSKSSRSCEETLAYTPQAKNRLSFTYESKMRDEAHTADPAACNQAGVDSRSSCKSDTPSPLTPCKKRVLPAWMMDVTPATLKTPPAKAAKRAPARAPARNTPSSKPSGPKRPRTRLPSLSGEEEEEKGVEEDEEEGCSTAPRKRARRLKSDTEESQDQAPVSESSQETPPEDEDAKEANVVQKTDEEDKEKESKRAEGSRRSKAGGSTLRPESSGSSQTNVQQKAKVQRRTPCPYGTSCYRKNPIHFQECSHPGDGDYEEEQNNEDDEDDDRPECPYGTDCYRKNPLHKKEYKHTKPPEKKTAPVDDDDDDDDEDQYENSFINDEREEEDVDEDSDYVPESEDSGKEDVKRLQKEAKAFLRRKK